jgi:Peptidase family M28
VTRSRLLLSSIILWLLSAAPAQQASAQQAANPQASTQQASDQTSNQQTQNQQTQAQPPKDQPASIQKTSTQQAPSHRSGSRHAARAAAQIRGEMEFLASDALQGRGSGSHDELLAATFLGSQLQEIGIEPAGDNGGYIQDVYGEFNFRQGKKEWHTRNVIGILHGRDSKLKGSKINAQVILLTAHMDHLGKGKAVNGDDIYNGADDDASGCVAVLQLARALAHGKAPRRTVLFVFFGSEETGGQGNQYFLEHPPVPLTSIVANLEFEMIGRPDSEVKPEELWLTGFDRSNLGPELARHGARLVADPRPKQNFFQRSDNYALAEKGIVAHTVSSFGLHADYHRPSDDIAHLDFTHMEQAIQSMLGPVKWLANSSFKPDWAEGKKP